MKIGPYELLSEVGRGGMGVVYKARSAEGAEVALKLLLEAKPERRARFERERRLLASLGEAEGFVPLLDAGEAPRGPYVVMPFVGGGTLRGRLARGPLGIDEAVALGARLAASVGLAHERGIVHRDLKPENILFTTDGRALVADLGLAKHFDRDAPGAGASASVSAAGSAVGTMGFMAPEQMTDAKSVGPTADVFALGAILYECLAGRPAFDGETALEVMHKVASSSVPSLARYRPEAPRWLVQTILRCLASRATERFADGHDLARALRPPAARRGRRVLLALVVLVVLGGGVGIALARRSAETVPGHAVPPPPRGPSVADLVERADDKIQRNDYAGAFADASQAVERDPTSSPAWTVRAIARSDKDLPTALVDLTRAIELDPKNARAWYVRGVLGRNAGQTEPAIKDLTVATELAPGWAAPWKARGLARVDRSDHEGAIADFSRAIALAPDLAGAWVERGHARQVLGDHKGAIPDYSRALELEPKVSLVWTYRANAKVFVGDYAGVIEDSTQALALDPLQAKAWEDRALAKVATNDAEGAILDCDRAIEVAPRSAPAWDMRGTAKLKTGDAQGAASDFRRALELDPRAAETYANLGSALVELGDNDGAIASYEQFLERAPNDPSADRVRRQVERLKTERGR